MFDGTCDYRKPECVSTGLEIKGRWYCLNHLPEDAVKPLPAAYTEDQIADAFWKSWEQIKGAGTGAGNAVIYGLLENLKAKR